MKKRIDSSDFTIRVAATGAVMTVIVAAIVWGAAHRDDPLPESVPVAESVPDFRIGIVTDVHGHTGKRFDYAWMEPETVMEPLIRFTSFMNDVFSPHVVVSVGDLIEGSDRAGQKSVTDFGFVTKALLKTRVPVLHVIGNHDRRGLTDGQWETLTDNETTFSFRDVNDIRLVLLDYDDVGKSGTDDDTLPIRPSNGKYLMSESQFDWIEKSLSEVAYRRVVVFIHSPIIESAVRPGNLINPPEQRQRLRDLFAKYHVDAVVSGHVETLRYEEDRNVRYFVFPGFYRSEINGKPVTWYGAYAALTLADDASALFRYQRVIGGPYEEVRIPSPEFDALDK